MDSLRASKETRSSRVETAQDTLVDVQSRRLYLCSDVTDDTVFKLLVGLDILNQDSKPIELLINSPGGYIYDGFALFDAIRNSPNVITAIATGHVMSMATVILQAADHRLMTRRCRLMIHPSHCDPGHLVAREAVALGRETQAIEQQVANVLAWRTGQSLDAIKKLIDEETYMDTLMAQELNFVDGIYEGPQGPKRTP